MIRTLDGRLAPLSDDDATELRKIKAGAVVECKVTRKRNPMFHRKMIVLFRTCYDSFTESLDTGVEYKGQLVKASFDRFRHDLVILAGHYEPVYNIKGEVRLEQKSISFSSCTEEEAEAIYSDVINAALKYVYRQSKSEAWLRETVDRILSFD